MMLVLAGPPILAVCAAPVRLRAGAEPPPGEVVAVGPSGVTISASVGHVVPNPAATSVLGWDRVLAVEGPMAGQAERFKPIADSAWRARTRLERGDPIAAEPLFESLFETYRGARGPTAALVAEGLLRCRLRRGAHFLAIEPWLSLLNARAEGGSGAGEVLDLPRVVDPATGLLPALPPICLSWPSTTSYARSEPWPSTDSASRDRVGDLARLYHLAARFEAGLPVEFRPVDGSDPAVALVADVVLARLGDAEQREVARRGLRDRLGPEVNAWVEVWCRVAIGRSLLREESPDDRRLGVVELLHAPARFARAHPYLAGLALAQASVALRELGDAPGADRLGAEFIAGYPDHPAQDWEPFRSARSPMPPPSGPPGNPRAGPS